MKNFKDKIIKEVLIKPNGDNLISDIELCFKDGSSVYIGATKEGYLVLIPSI